MKIVNAKDKPLFGGNGNLPNMGDALLSWFQQIQFVLITKEIVDFELIEVEKPSCFMGVIQPLSSKKLEMKPEGQRAWTWSQIHASPDLVLKNDDVMNIQGVRYRVMNKFDYSKYNYVLYEIVEDFTK